MNNILLEHKYVQHLHTEYLQLINYFHNIKRGASFIKYYSLNNESMIDNNSNVTYDRFTKTNHKWDIYELTPAFLVNQIINTTSSVDDLKGQMIDSSTTITVYTINEPKIDDLITFYEPIKSSEVFRVSNIRMQLNSMYSDPAIKWFDLDLETAPIKYDQINELNKANHYIYDLSAEKNILYIDYINEMKKLDKIKKILIEIMKFYSFKNDYFYSEDYIPEITNSLLFNWKKKYNNKYKRLFEDIRSPFGYWDKFEIKEDNNFIEDLTYYNIYDIIKKSWFLYEWKPGIENSNLDKLLNLTYILFIEISNLK